MNTFLFAYDILIFNILLDTNFLAVLHTTPIHEGGIMPGFPSEAGCRNKPKHSNGKTARGYTYSITEQLNGDGIFRWKRLSFGVTTVPGSELLEVFGTEFLMASVDSIQIETATGRLSIYYQARRG
jgi:hypothetical protein